MKRVPEKGSGSRVDAGGIGYDAVRSPMSAPGDRCLAHAVPSRTRGEVCDE